MLRKTIKESALCLFLIVGLLSVSMAASRYNIDEIPDQGAWPDYTLAFFVHWDDDPTASFTCAADPEPVGVYGIEVESGADWRFHYTPDDAAPERHPFTVTITATSGGQSTSDSFQVTPLADLVPEYSVFGDEKNYVKPIDPMGYGPNSSVSHRVTEVDCDGMNCANQINHEQAAKFVSIVGTTVVFTADPIEPGDQSDLLYDTYNYDSLTKNGNDTGKMEIIADTVKIYDPLHLPQTEVVIFARELIFIGDGKIITTPLEHPEDPKPANARAQYWLAPDCPECSSTGTQATTQGNQGKRNETSGSPGEDGAAGLDAGSVTLYIDQILPYDYTMRFGLRGGNGQNPGWGRSGLDSPYANGGVPYNSYINTSNVLGTEYDYYPAPNGYLGYVVPWAYHVCPFPSACTHHFIDNGNGELKYPGWPYDGTDAMPAGRPGRGGKGGDLTANQVIHYSFSHRWHGDSGLTGDTYLGGAASFPPAWLKLRFVEQAFNDHWEVVGVSHYSTPGEDAVSPGPLNPNTDADNGENTFLSNPYSWLHPLLAGRALNTARDHYLRNDITEAQTLLQIYVDAIEDYRLHSTWNSNYGDAPALYTNADQYALVQIYDEMQLLLTRLESGLDYFGNPLGWVPMLSFETYLVNFDHQINRAIRQLYLVHRIKTKAQTATDTDDALSKQRNRLAQELEAAKQTLNDEVVPSLNPLKNEAQAIKEKIQQIRMDIRDKENELEQQAQQYPWKQDWFRASRIHMKTAAVLCSNFPAFQPLLGTIGDVDRYISEINYQDPDFWEDLINAPGQILEDPGIVERFLSDIDIEGCVENINQVAQTIVTGNADAIDWENPIKELQKPENSGQLTADLTDLRDCLNITKMPQSWIDAKMQELRSQSVEMGQLTDNIAKRQQEYGKVAAKIAARIEEIGELNNLIAKTLLEIGALNDTISVSAEGVIQNQKAIFYLENVERRTYDRLLKYQYYLAKAYEYRLLVPYPHELNLEPLFTAFAAISTDDLSDDDDDPDFLSLKAVYSGIIDDITLDILNGYESYSQSLEQPGEIDFILTPEELARLNEPPLPPEKWSEPILVNPFVRGLIPPGRENLRITDIYPTNIEALQVTGGPDFSATVTMRVEHPGLSIMKSEGGVHQFKHHGQTASNSPNSDTAGDDTTQRVIHWEMDYQPANSTIHETEAVTPHQISLLTTLLGPDAPPNLELFSRPGVSADLIFSRSDTSTNDATFDIERAEFRLEYAYHDRTQSSRKELQVLVAKGLLNLEEGPISCNFGPDRVIQNKMIFATPHFIVDTPDMNGRQDGRGAFLRIYDSHPDDIVVAAPKEYGALLFRKWTTWGGCDLYGGPFTNPAIPINCYSGDQVIAAQYVEPNLYFDTGEDGDIDGMDLVDLADNLETGQTSPALLSKFAGVFGYQR